MPYFLHVPAHVLLLTLELDFLFTTFSALALIINEAIKQTFDVDYKNYSFSEILNSINKAVNGKTYGYIENSILSFMQKCQTLFL